jgi:hypothetical protein
MMLRKSLVLIVVACALSACGVGVRRSGTLRVPPAGPQNATDMVNSWDAARKAESQCNRDSGQKNDKGVNPACGDYKP